MSTTLFATFDGKVLRPEEPVALEPNTRVRVTIEAATPDEDGPMSFFDTARELRLDGPPDWAARLDHYLYDEDSE